MNNNSTPPHVDEVFIKSPHRWDVTDIRSFMLIFGPLSSLSDFATFALLLWGLIASQQAFRSGWFIESVLSAALVVFAVWTYLPFVESRPRRTMLVITELFALAALVLPYTPLAVMLGFTPLPLTYLVMILIIVAIYFIVAEFTNRLFFCQVRNHD